MISDPSPAPTTEVVATAALPDSGPASAASARDVAAEVVREGVRRLERAGFQPVEAGNVVALGLGLRPVPGGWTASQIQHLLFVRAIVRDGILRA